MFLNASAASTQRDSHFQDILIYFLEGGGGGGGSVSGGRVFFFFEGETEYTDGGLRGFNEYKAGGFFFLGGGK